jgi:hypothetical protein
LFQPAAGRTSTGPIVNVVGFALEGSEAEQAVSIEIYRAPADEFRQAYPCASRLENLTLNGYAVLYGPGDSSSGPAYVFQSPQDAHLRIVLALTPDTAFAGPDQVVASMAATRRFSR